MHPPADPTQPRHPIRVAAQRSGITPDLLRAWERRYGAVLPGRSGTARRLYSDADIERLRALRQLTELGHAIGGIAQRPLSELRALIAAGSEAAQPRAARGPHPSLQRAVDAMAALDGRLLRRVLGRAALELGPSRLVDELLAPFCDAIGDGWAAGRVTVAHEHLASVAMRDTLGGLFEALVVDLDGPVVVATTPSGERHEFGAMMAASAAATAGWRAYYLGPDLPAGDIGAAARQLGAEVVMLSIVGGHGRGMEQELRRVRSAVGDDVAILAGGSGAPALGSTLDGIGARRLAGLDGIAAVLGELAGAAGRSG